PRGVLAHEVRDDMLAELLLEIEDVVRDVDRHRNATGVVQILDGAAAAKRMLARLIVELHRQANDLMTLLGEQGRGHRRIHAARHRNYNPHVLSSTSCLATKPRRTRSFTKMLFVRGLLRAPSCSSCLRGLSFSSNCEVSRGASAAARRRGRPRPVSS